MAAYGKAALLAVELLKSKTCESPEDAWRLAVAEMFAHSQSAQSKGCPRGTFLGLCSSGAIEGIPAGNYTRSTKNKHYGLRALAILRRSPFLANDESALWEKVIAGKTKVPNCQMEIVTSLWNSGLFNGEPMPPSPSLHRTCAKSGAGTVDSNVNPYE